MASQSFAPSSVPVRRISLAEIDAIVSARLGPTGGLGNSQPACFNRQVAMYLAARVGRWSTTIIGRFYSGRDHSTVCHGIQRIESLRETDPEIDSLLTDLNRRLSQQHDSPHIQMDPAQLQEPELRESDIEKIAAAVAERVFALFQAKLPEEFARVFRGTPTIDVTAAVTSH